MVYTITALVVSFGYNNLLMGLRLHLGLLLYGGWTCIYGVVLLLNYGDGPFGVNLVYLEIH